MKKRILCYGDSNTYGYVPAGNGRRYSENVRWPAKLGRLLGEDYTVIEEGLPGRTADLCEEFPWKEGNSYLYAALSTHRPIDMAVIMLGTNDTKKSFQRDARAIAETVSSIVEDTRNFLIEKQGYSPEILLVSPPPLDPAVCRGAFAGDFDSRSVQVSHQLKEAYQDIAEKTGCLFLDAGEYAEVSKKDGVHMEPEGHLKLADGIYQAMSEWYAEHPSDTDEKHLAMIEEE